jgi:hemerythrin-like domain-containing protein
MSNAIDDLMHEHKAILFALSVLDKIVDLAQNGMDSIKKDSFNLLDFLKEFADKCHHGKEEGILFPAMEKAGIKKENGPIGVMLVEHELGRKYIREMAAEVEKDKELGKEGFRAAGNSYSALMKSHINKENEVLFPMGEKKIAKNKLDEIYKQFELHEEIVIGKGRHDELHVLLNKFKQKYIK